MSAKENSKDESFPWITAGDMSKWHILIRAYLRPKKGDRALDSDRPVLDPELLVSLLVNGDETRRSSEYRRKVAHKVKLWVKRNDLAYAALVKAVTYAPSALTVVLDNPSVTAKELFDLLTRRFDQKDMTGVVQAKLAAFNSMTLDSSEKAEDFINRLILAKIDLNNLGCDYVDKDIYCLGRLKEGLLTDTRFQDVALNLSCAVDMTWDRAVQIVTAVEASRTTLKNGKSTTYTPQISSGLDTAEKGEHAAVRRLRAKFGKQVKHLKGKLNAKYKKYCNYCHKSGHLEPECRDKIAKFGNNKKKEELRTCYTCGKPGHLAKDCHKRKRDDRDDGDRGRARSGKHVDNYFSDGESSRMLSEYSARRLSTAKAVLDSGATSHMLSNGSVEGFANKKLCDTRQKINTAHSGQSFVATSRGAVGALKDVLVIADNTLSENIASVPRFDRDGNYVVFGGGHAHILPADAREKIEEVLRDTAHVAHAKLDSDNTYRLLLQDVVGSERVMLGSATPEETLELWHKRLGHRNKRDLGHAIKTKLLRGISDKASVHKKDGLCDACVRAKSTRTSFSRAAPASLSEEESRSTLFPVNKVVKRTDTDLKGPFSVPGMKGELYFQLFTETDSKFSVIKFLSAKSQAPLTVQEYIDVDLASEGQSLLEYHSDGAPELISREITLLLAARGCKLSYSAAYTPEQNGLAERQNRTVWESAYAMWMASALPALFWTYACMYANIIRNVLPTSTTAGWMSPFEAKYGVSPDVHIFRVFGCIAFVHVPAATRDSTFTDKAERGYFVGLKWPLLDRYLAFVPTV